MLIKRPADIRSSEITDKKLYLNRRQFIQTAGAIAGAATGVGVLTKGAAVLHAVQPAAHGRKLENVKKGSPFSNTNGEVMNTWEQITTYNNFYEFGTDKDQPAELSRNFKTDGWSVSVEGECAKPGKYSIDDILKGETIEERIYRMRCVEAWSMVIPWAGIPLGNLIKRFGPTPKANYVRMSTLVDPKRMPGQRSDVLEWPYVEALRMDEAMHPLAILAVGIYGEALPNQDGAPIRLVVPWKYGFKGVKSIVKIEFTEKQPVNTWQKMAPREYGFYANVNPEVNHPRWSQASERRIGEFFMRKTLMFNGYGEQVAGLYNNIDLKKNY
jgi:methionine sulfoxide reductase catalytic subunit